MALDVRALPSKDDAEEEYVGGGPGRLIRGQFATA
jgi:hypothetical protein